jgi:hypothetical protein
LLVSVALWIDCGYGVRNRSTSCQREGATVGKHRAITRDRLAGGLLLGAAASGALAIASLSGAGAANATCASISGISAGSSGGSTCTSTATSFAVGLGNNTTSTANGMFDGSIAVGTNAEAHSRGTLNLAVAIGNPTSASPVTFADALGHR